jgi:ribosomal protein L11 methyltransferase
VARFPKHRGRPSRWRGRPPPPPGARRPSERDIWRCRFRVPAESVEVFWWAFADDALSVSAFEEEEDGDHGGDAGGGLWRIELLHEGPPDRAALERQLAGLAAEHGLPPVDLGCEPVPSTDWLIEVARRFPPTRIGRFFIHGREHAEPPPADTIPLQIEAGQAFGSGEHATTRGCLLALDSLARRRRLRRVLDLGCGSGVLAIAAAKAWPARVVAADNDPVAVAVAAENAGLNGVDGRVRAVESDGYAHPLIAAFGPYDLVLANLLADLHQELARDLARYLAPDGVAVLSGVLDRQADAVVAAHWPYGLRLRRTIAIGPWATLVLARTRGR